MYQEIPLQQIHFTHRNPRSDPESGLEELAASLGDENSPRLAQYPLVEKMGENQYRVIAGERRIRAAALRGWASIPCVIAASMDALEIHHLRLVENLHRKSLHPLDEAAALKIAWLSANAEALGLAADVRAILDSDLPNPQTLADLQTLLASHGFSPNAPAVPWEKVLDTLGVSMHPESRKKLLGVLTVDTSVQETIKTLDVSEAGLRAIGRLEAADQQRLVQEIAEHPELARKVRRIARVVNDGSYTLDEALAEAQGRVVGEAIEEIIEDSSPEIESEQQADNLLFDNRLMDAAMELLEIANRLTISLTVLKETSGGNLADLPQPWGEYALEALGLIRNEITQLDQ